MPQHPPARPLRAAGDRANAEAFDRAVEEIAAASARLLDALVTTAPPKDRELEATKARARSAVRFDTSVPDPQN